MADTTVAILSSNILGPQALLDHGFDWVEEPDATKLAIALSKLYSMEQGWKARIRQWQTEGAMGDDFAEVSPGALVWLVAIDSDEFARRNNHALGKIAQMVGSCEPHAKICFDSDRFDAQAIALRLSETLRLRSPISCGSTSGKRKAKANEVRSQCQAAVAGGALLPA